jgi:hypothetical protein
MIQCRSNFFHTVRATLNIISPFVTMHKAKVLVHVSTSPGEISLIDFPSAHPGPHLGRIIVYPPIIALALDIVERNAKDIQFDETAQSTSSLMKQKSTTPPVRLRVKNLYAPHRLLMKARCGARIKRTRLHLCLPPKS